MKTYASYTALGLLGVLTSMSGCTVTDTSSSDGGSVTADDGSSTDTSTPGIDGGTEGATPESSSALPDAASCGVVTSDSPACEACIEANCCALGAACDVPDDAGTDDAGFTSCDNIVSCVNDLCADGGSVSDCVATCGLRYSASAQAAATDVLTCVSGQCSAPCGGDQ